MHLSKIFTAILVSLSFSQAQAAAGEVAVDVTLSPAGSFKAETKKVTGTASKTADGVVAENIIIDATTLVTGVSLRDDHLKKRLLTQKFPQIKLVKAIGKNGKGKGKIDIMGKSKTVEGTYTVDGGKLNAQFKMKLSDLAISDVSYMGIGVKDEVTVHVSVPISDAPARDTATSGKKTARK